MTSADPRYGTVDRAYGRRLATTSPDEDGPVWMVNLMRYRERADDGGGEDGGVTGREADDRYAPTELLADVGARIAFVGDVEAQPLGAPQWDRVAIVRYPTRRSFIDMQARGDFQEKHVHKAAGMAETIVMGATPAGTPTVVEPPSWDSVPHPPTADDGPLVVLHVLRFAEQERMRGYEQVAGEVAIPHGVRPSLWLDVEGTIVGDGRTWDQVRLNAFPSRRALRAVFEDERRRTAQASHREPAIADTCTMLVRPTVDRIDELVGAA